MSGRARIYQGRHYAYIYWTGEPLQVARFEQGGRWKPVCMDGPTFKRRSDAKRWLLARAAGLAEVPRWRASHFLAGKVPGWRVTRRVLGGEHVGTVFERNRRRR